jgi:selenocysteine-specific elongation factor
LERVKARNFVIATAGHVDHGKSALVKALTSTDPDRLPEEKARGMTIELGFAHLELSAPSTRTCPPEPRRRRNPQPLVAPKQCEGGPVAPERCEGGPVTPEPFGVGGSTFSVAIIDVPGHEDFIRNMIAGVGSIDLALLVVAADDGWMPQTEEHLQILTYLGVNRAVVALTKIDLGGAEQIFSQIRDQLRDTAFAQSPVIAISVRTGTGIQELKRALASELSTIQGQRDTGKPRLFVDRAFTLHGIGTVVTGTLTGGGFQRGQAVVVQPRASKARIRSMQSHGCEIEAAWPGMRTAINLPDLAIGTSATAIGRGDIVTTVALDPSSTLDVVLEKSPRLCEKNSAARRLKTGASIYLHHGTARVPSKVVLLEHDALECGERAIAQLRLESPVFAFLGDRFVIRDPSGQYTIAGGLVLDPDADREAFRSVAQQKLLTARAAKPNDLDTCVGSEIARRGPVHVAMLLRKSPFSANQIAQALLRLQTRREVVICGEIVADSFSWKRLRDQAIDLIDKAHQENSDRPGLDLNELRANLPHQTPAIFEALISNLCADDFVRQGSTIARNSHRPALSVRLEPIAAKILTALSENRLDPPTRKEIALDREAQQALRFLIKQRCIVEISSDVVLLEEDFERMKSGIVEFISRRGPATVSQLRQELQTSRRITVPLLEQLDRDGVTRRVGDRRILANAPIVRPATTPD